MNNWKLKFKKITIYNSSKKNMIYLAITLTKYVQGLHAENYKTLMKQIKEDLNKQGDLLCSCIRRFIIVKMSNLPN